MPVDMGALSKKAGPLPVGAWAAIVVGGLGISYYINKNRSASADVAAIPNVGSSYGGGGTVGAGAVGGGGSGYVTSTTTGSSASAASTAPATNEAWLATASQALKSRGTYDSYAINVALRKYLGGQALTPTEQSIVNLALDAAGPTPGILNYDANYLKPATQGFFKMIGDAYGRIYEVLSDGTYQWVSPTAYAKAGSPSVVEASSDSPVFAGTQIGADPFPGNRPPATETSTGFYRYGDTLAVYEFFSNGTRKFVDYATWVAKGAPKAANVNKNDAIWSRPVVGFDPLAKPASQAPGPVSLSVGTVLPVGSNLPAMPLTASPNQ